MIIKVDQPIQILDCGQDVTFHGTAGKVNALGSVRCDSVSGNVSAGGSVHCDDIGGSISAGGSIK